MFEKLAIGQIVESIAVLPAGEGVYLVDVVMRDLSLDCTWNGAITIPQPQANAGRAWKMNNPIAIAVAIAGARNFLRI